MRPDSLITQMPISVSCLSSALIKNFTTYLTNFRINEAKRLLKDRNISVKDAGMKVGYYDSNYFAKVFKRVTGMIPSEYREAN